jgi:hypothetical protein
MNNERNDINIINKICESYDTSLVDKLSKNGYKVLKNIITKYNIKNVKFKGLFYILFNKINKIQKMYMNSYYGADSFIYMTSDKYDKYVYLIGETHREYIPCDNKVEKIKDLIMSNLRNTDKFIDVFLETDIKEKNINIKVKRAVSSSTNVIFSIIDELGSCLSFTKEECDLYGSRIHYTDPRHIFYHSFNYNLELFGWILVSIMNLLLRIVYNNDYKSYSDKILRYLRKEEQGMRKLLKDSDTVKENLISIFTKYYKYEKNLNNLSDNKVKNYLQEYLMNSINRIRYDNLVYDELISNLTSLSPNSILDLYFSIFELMIAFMDVYLISRLFRDYKSVKYQNSKSAKYSIIITGDTHTQNYVRMLSDLGFKTRINIKKDNDCLHNIPSVLF